MLLMDINNDKISQYFDRLIKNNYPTKEFPKHYSWDWIMSLLELVEESLYVQKPVEIFLQDNYCRINCKALDGEEIVIQDKGMDKKEAISNCCFRFFQRFDKEAPSINLKGDSFLLDD